MTIRIVLADDHQIIRDGLRSVLRDAVDLEIVGEAADGRSALERTLELAPDVLVADILMPQINGLELARQVRRQCPKTRVVMLSMHADAPYVLEALRAGAIGYVLKDSGAAELAAAVRAAAAGERYLSPPLDQSPAGQAALAGDAPPADPFDTLTPREREVLRLTAEGLSGTAAAERLAISPRTVETHRAHIMRKLGVRNQKELIRYAIQRGMVR